MSLEEQANDDTERMARLGRHVTAFASRYRWDPTDGEGAFEFIQRHSYVVGYEDAGGKAGQDGTQTFGSRWPITAFVPNHDGHSNLRDQIGKALSTVLTRDGMDQDWLDSLNVDLLADAVLTVLPVIPALQVGFDKQFDAVWNAVNWEVWRSRQIKELVKHIYDLLKDAAPSSLSVAILTWEERVAQFPTEQFGEPDPEFFKDAELADLRAKVLRLAAVQKNGEPVAETYTHTMHHGRGRPDDPPDTQMTLVRLLHDCPAGVKLYVAPPAPVVARPDLSKLTRLGWSEAYAGDTSELVEDAKGTYFRVADVEALLAALPPQAPDTTTGEPNERL